MNQRLSKTIIVLTTVLILPLYLMLGSIVEAVPTPTFPSCLAPQGSTKVSYDDGTHGIIGSGATHTGSDTVYQISDDTLTQCFCDENGRGIQTNWLKASDLSDTDIQILRNDGWQYAPNGALWGLDSAPYIARNIDYSCDGEVGGSTAEIVTSTPSLLQSIFGFASSNQFLLTLLAWIAALLAIAWAVVRRRR